MFKSIDNSAYEHPEEDCITRPSSKSSIYQSPRDDKKLRVIACLLASFLVFGNDYCYDLPQALETQIQEKFGVNEVQYNLLYSVYSMPNIILPFFGGYLLDYFGIKVGVLLFNFLIIVGQGLFTLGSYGDNYFILIIGRSVFGVGAECLNVAQSTIVTMWFKNKELSCALGISLCICRLGSSLNSYLSPLLFDQFKSIGHVSAFGMVFLIISLVCGLGLIKMDSKYLKGEKYEDSERISFKDIKSFKPNFWILYVNGILCFMSFFSFLNISNKYIQRRFMLAATVAGGLLTIPYVVGGLLTPVLSSVIDKKGKKATLLMLACLLLSYNHFTLSALPDCDGCLSIIMPLVLFGVFFAFYTSLLIPCVSIISEERVMGTAMGIIYSGQNTGLAIGPLLVGSILSDESELSNEYITMSIVLAACSFVAFVFAVANWWYDKYHNKGILQKGMKELEAELHERKFEIEISDFEL